MHYTMIIQWSNEDNVFIVTLPEFNNCHTHGDTYEEALQNGKELLEMLIEDFQALGDPLPKLNPYIAA